MIKRGSKLSIIREFYCYYNYILELELSATTKIQLKNYCKHVAVVFNKTLELQREIFKQGFKEPLSPSAVRGMLPIWMEEPGNGTMCNVPITVLNASIADCCKKVKEAFNSKMEFKLPIPIDRGYQHLEFPRKVKFDEKLNRIQLPGFDMSYKYTMVKFDAPTKGRITGSSKKVWVVYHENKWLALVLCKVKSSAGRGAAKTLLQQSRVRQGEFVPLVYDKTHWIVVAHDKRTASYESEDK